MSLRQQNYILQDHFSLNSFPLPEASKAAMHDPIAPCPHMSLFSLISPLTLLKFSPSTATVIETCRFLAKIFL